MAIDRNAIVNAITFGKAATGLIPDSVKGFRENSLISGGAKLDDAKAIVDAAGLSAADKKITLTVNDDEQSVAIANLVKEAWDYIGFTVTVKPVSVKKSKITDFTNNEKIDISDSAIQYTVKAASRGDRDFDVIAVDWQMFTDDAFVALAAFSTRYSGSGKIFSDKGNVALGSFGGYSNADYDALIDKAFKSTDKDERLAALRDAEKLLIETAAVAPIIYNQTFYFTNKEISKVSFNGFGNIVLNETKQKHYEDYYPEK
jgi:ABC-type transport system substrate-binding protein